MEQIQDWIARGGRLVVAGQEDVVFHHPVHGRTEELDRSELQALSRRRHGHRRNERRKYGRVNDSPHRQCRLPTVPTNPSQVIVSAPMGCCQVDRSPRDSRH